MTNISKFLTGKRVFLSYASADKQKADKLAFQLQANGVELFSESDIQIGEKWQDAIQYHLRSSDYILICFSKNTLSNEWFRFEYEQTFLNYAKDRHINIVPIKFDSTPLPDNLNEFQSVDLDMVFATNYDRIISKMLSLENISFDDFSAVKFEELILELLHNLNFTKIEWYRKIDDRGFDFITEHLDRDPFGLIEKQTWIIECKLYKSGRFDINSIRSIVDSYKYLQRKDAKLALITNSQFTSVVKEYVASVRNTDFIDIRLIDGFHLKKIVSAQPDVVERYFKS